jgi:hypothetical protein
MLLSPSQDGFRFAASSYVGQDESDGDCTFLQVMKEFQDCLKQKGTQTTPT